MNSVKEFVIMLHQIGLRSGAREHVYRKPILKEAYYFDDESAALARLKDFKLPSRTGMFTLSLYKISETQLLTTPFDSPAKLLAAIKAYEEGKPVT